jgi:AcrR family transcriptional regulator
VRDTKTHILDVAERHFGLYGYSGTTLRGVIKEAGVNVAAVAYHFGSKDDLFVAVVERFALPVVEAQLMQLRQAMQKRSPRMADVLRAFYEPPVRQVEALGAQGQVLSMFLGRAQTEPEPAYSLMDPQFAACRDEFIAAFRRLQPDESEASLHWRFEFMLSLIVCYLTRQTFIRARYEEADDTDAVDRLVTFCARGMSG